MFLHHITNGFREVKQQFSFLRTKACRVKENVNIFKALLPTVLFITLRILEKKGIFLYYFIICVNEIRI